MAPRERELRSSYSDGGIKNGSRRLVVGAGNSKKCLQTSSPSSTGRSPIRPAVLEFQIAIWLVSLRVRRNQVQKMQFRFLPPPVRLRSSHGATND